MEILGHSAALKSLVLLVSRLQIIMSVLFPAFSAKTEGDALVNFIFKSSGL